MTDSEKLDLIVQKVSTIESHVAVHAEKHQNLDRRATTMERDMGKIKEGQNKMFGGMIVISAVFTAIGTFAYKLFFGHQ